MTYHTASVLPFAYPHAHCPCEVCQGKAVSRSTEFRHWECTKDALREWESEVHDDGCTSPDIDANVDVGGAESQSIATGETQDRECVNIGDTASGIDVPSTSTSTTSSSPMQEAIDRSRGRCRY